MQMQDVDRIGTQKSVSDTCLPSADHWPCGHDRSADNSAKCGKGRTRCRACSLVNGRKYHYVGRAPKPHDPLAYRQRYLPRQLEATERKLAMLQREAVRIGLGHLVGGAA